jgi:hypothetical protein
MNEDPVGGVATSEHFGIAGDERSTQTIGDGHG